MAAASSISSARQRTKRKLSYAQLAVRRALKAPVLDPGEFRQSVSRGLAAGTMKYPPSGGPLKPAGKGVA